GAGLDDRTIRVLLDGTEVGSIDIPNIDYESFTEVKLAPVAFNSGPATLRVEFSGGGINFDYFRIGDAEPLADADPDDAIVFAIRAGSVAYESEAGVYQSDLPFAVGGNLSGLPVTVMDADENALYQGWRWGTFSYELPIDNGTYDVTLKMAELYWQA